MFKDYMISRNKKDIQVLEIQFFKSDSLISEFDPCFAFLSSCSNIRSFKIIDFLLLSSV